MTGTIELRDAARLPISLIHQAPWNANVADPKTLDKVRRSLERFGSVENSVVRATWCIGARSQSDLMARKASQMDPPTSYETLSGNHRLNIYREAGLAEVPCVVVELTDADARMLAQTLNRTRGQDDPDKLKALLKSVVADIPVVDVSAILPESARDLSALLNVVPPGERGTPDPGDETVFAPPENPSSEEGRIYQLGPHRLLCGDSTNEEKVRELCEGSVVGCILTDPPYCSGGFQEAGRSKGSVGTNAAHKPIANDTLSTRGYQALMRRTLSIVDAPLMYVFTDWRMWVNLFDVVESCSYGVRSMIVWGKDRAGMGRGWKSQHELIMCAVRDKEVFADLPRGKGNVISAKRTGNDLHTTQKPLAVLETLLSVDAAAPTAAGFVFDPFAGSGSTMLAAQAHNRRAALAELDPAYCDVVRRRWGDYARANDIEPGPDAL